MTQANNPLHGLTLETLVVRLQQHYGWEGLAERISINCFRSDPSVKSSLKFLRRTPWAREQVEELYTRTFANPDQPVSVPVRKSAPRRPNPRPAGKPAANSANKPAGKGFAWPSVKSDAKSDS